MVAGDIVFSGVHFGESDEQRRDRRVRARPREVKKDGIVRFLTDFIDAIATESVVVSHSSRVADQYRERQARIDLVLRELNQHMNSLIALALAIEQVDGAFGQFPKARADRRARTVSSNSGPDADMVG